MLDLEGLEGAATLSSLESQSRIFQYQNEQHQNMAMPAQPSDSFPQDLRPMRSQSSDAMHDPAINGSSVVLDDGPMLDMDESSLADFLNGVMANPNTMGDFMPQAYPPRDIFSFGSKSKVYVSPTHSWTSLRNPTRPYLSCIVRRILTRRYSQSMPI